MRGQDRSDVSRCAIRVGIRRFSWLCLSWAMGLGCGSAPPPVFVAFDAGMSDAGTSSSPHITALSPATVVAGSGDLRLTVTGSGFVPGHHRTVQVVWVSAAGVGPSTILSSTVDSDTELSALVPAALLTTVGTAQVHVESYDPMSDAPVVRRSNAPSVRIVEAPPPRIVFTGFSSTGSMGLARSWHTATLLGDGSVLVVGGWGELDLVPGAELFDAARGAFSPVGDPAIRRAGATATRLLDGRVLVVGGFDGPLHRTAGAEIFDPVTRAFRAVGSMAQPRATHQATLLSDGKVLISGGTRDGGGGGAAISTAEIFDPVTETFSPTGSMLSERAEHTATLLPSGDVLIVGGFNGHFADAPDDPPWDPLEVELFEPATGRFSEAGTDSTTRSGHGAALLWDGRVLLVGGVWDIQNRHEQPRSPQYSEFFDPWDRSFTSSSDIRFSQGGFTFTELSGRQVLVAGGSDANGPVTSASVIDAANGSVAGTPGMLLPRMGHTATRLLDGRVLVTGGNNGQGTVYSSAEIFH